MKLEVHVIAWNEKDRLPFLHRFYTQRFGDVKFVIHDNMSDDGSVEICYQLGMEVQPYDSGEKLCDKKYVEIKNECWKNCKGWVIVSDCDEWLDITEEELSKEDAAGSTILTPIGYTMINGNGTTEYDTIRIGLRQTRYDKRICFKAGEITAMNYGIGGHRCSPCGNVQKSQKSYNLLHMHYLSELNMLERYHQYAKRMSNDNRTAGWGNYYLMTDQQIVDNYRNHLAMSKSISKDTIDVTRCRIISATYGSEERQIDVTDKVMGKTEILVSNDTFGEDPHYHVTKKLVIKTTDGRQIEIGEGRYANLLEKSQSSTERPEGWFTDNEGKAYASIVNKNTRVMEIGTWKGRSTSYILDIVNDIVVVDKWEDCNLYKSAAQSLNQLVKMLEKNNWTHKVTILKMSSEQAAERYASCSFDVVMIDASHEYEDVKSDIAMWYPKIESGGWICGHDYRSWDGVTKAVKERLGEVDILVDSFWAKKV